MIQLNLLPEVKMQYVKAQRTRSLVLSSAILIAGASIALLVLLIIVGGLQKKHINDLNKDIKAYTAKLQKEPDLTKILTVQNQLNSLTALHSSKPAVANLFTYLNDVTPVQASINNFTIDFNTQTATISGTADSLSSVNKYVDTLKYTKYTVDNDTQQMPAFKDVVLSNFSVNTGTKDGKQAVAYNITLSFDPAIFDITKTVKLVVPSQTTTRAQPGQTSDLFTSAAPSTDKAESN